VINLTDHLQDSRTVSICTPDHVGRLIGKKRDVDDWPRLAKEGLAMPDFHLVTGVDNLPRAGFAVAGEAQGFRNGLLMPDPGAAFRSPLSPATLHVLADPLTAAGAPVAEAPRNILGAQIDRLNALGVQARVASELEFYVFRQSFAEAGRSDTGVLERYYHRQGDNDVLVTELAGDLIDEIAIALANSGIETDQIQGEGGAGQFEINVAPATALVSADNHVVFKHCVKAVGHRMGHAVTFLAKPFADDAGSGGHIHLSLTKADGGNALGEGQQLSAFGRAFLAGILAHTPGLTLMHAPLANSYKRIVPGSFTPLSATWGWDNRTAMVRIVGGRDGPRFEFRLPGADMNPYHAYTALIAAGLAGVGEDRALPPEKMGGAEQLDAPQVPRDLTEALVAFEGSEVATEALGTAVKSHIASHGRAELSASRRAVTDWEFARGFEHA